MPPAPPAKRPARAGAKPTVPAQRDSAISGLSVNGSNSGSGTPDGGSRASTPSLAGGLAEALKARQASMQGKAKEEDDDW
jgi:myosin-1